MPLYITYTFAERPKVENWHFSKRGDIQRRICYAFVIAWLHCFLFWVCQYLYFETASCHAFFFGWRRMCRDRELFTLIPDNMEQIRAHIAVSLDGHTATLDQELDWLPDEVKAIIGKYYLDADCLLMGANTYNYIFEHWGGWPHKSKRSFVVSHYDTNVTPDCGVEFLTEEPLQRVYELKQETDMLVVGGGKLLTSLVKAGLLDSLTIYTVPVMVGKGIGFIGETFGSLWKLSESGVLDNGIVRSTYLFGGSI